MKLYKFAPISARCFPTIADLNNPWIFPKDVAVVVSVTPHYDAKIAEAIKAKEIDFYHFPLEEEVDDIGWENIKQAVAVLLKYNKEGKRIIVHCDFGQHRSRLVVEAFYYAKFGEHFTDEYKGFDNHLIYDCFSCHLPRLDIVEQELFQLSQNNSSLTCIHSTETAINVSAIAKSIEFIGVDEADFALKNEMFARPKHEPIHGIGHIYRTMIGCALLGELLQRPREGFLAFCGAYIHDLARETDGIEPEHGANAALKYFDRFNKLWDKYKLTQEEREQVKQAVTQHSGCEWMQPKDPGYHVMAILKDADALDRCRIGDLVPEWLRYAESKRLIKIIELIYVKTSSVNEEMEFASFVRKAMK